MKKRCRACGKEFPATAEFFPRHTGDRLLSRCRPCNRARARAYYAAHPERGRAYGKEHRAERRAWEKQYWDRNRERKREIHRRWRLAHPDVDKANSRTYYRAHSDSFKERARRWIVEHPDSAAHYIRIKNMRRRGVPVNAEGRAYIRTLRNDPCSYCGATGKPIVIDHITPVASGGTSDWWNLTASCAACNYRKSSKSLLQFIIDGGLTWEHR